MATDPEELLREAEDLIEDWLCELDTTWQATLADAEARAGETLAAAQVEAARSLAVARADAAEIVALARLEADSIIAEANATAGEHEDVIRALTTAEREAAGEELVSLREAVARLRTELSRLVDAAFDALPAVEATADAIDRAMGDDEPEPVLVSAAPRRGLLRRLFRR